MANDIAAQAVAEQDAELLLTLLDHQSYDVRTVALKALTKGTSAFTRAIVASTLDNPSFWEIDRKNGERTASYLSIEADFAELLESLGSQVAPEELRNPERRRALTADLNGAQTGAREVEIRGSEAASASEDLVRPGAGGSTDVAEETSKAETKSVQHSSLRSLIWGAVLVSILVIGGIMIARRSRRA